MNKRLILVIVLIAGVAAFAILRLSESVSPVSDGTSSTTPSAPATHSGISPPPPVLPFEPSLDAAVFVLPLDQAKKRVTKKPFGMFIDKKTSLIQPERFTGYHTGTDFETFPDEAAIDVPVHAICDGMLAMKRTASGYGGVAVESCTLSGEPITVVYGHLRLTSVDASVGTKVSAGDIIGVLGTGYGTETDGERKHLHLGIHKGGMIDITGYVSSSALLSGWTDPVPLISK